MRNIIIHAHVHAPHASHVIVIDWNCNIHTPICIYVYVRSSKHKMRVCVCMIMYMYVKRTHAWYVLMSSMNC
jgi:hypothetical protein